MRHPAWAILRHACTANSNFSTACFRRNGRASEGHEQQRRSLAPSTDLKVQPSHGQRAAVTAQGGLAAQEDRRRVSSTRRQRAVANPSSHLGWDPSVECSHGRPLPATRAPVTTRRASCCSRAHC
eukprot:364197-Chlamydomonas_euryale.AAC.7